MIDISDALRIPTARGSSAVRPQVATTPKRAWVSANRARSDAMTNVELSAISNPPDTHAPLTAQITGLLIARSARPGLFANCRSAGFAGAVACLRDLLEVDAGGEHRIDGGDHHHAHAVVVLRGREQLAEPVAHRFA